VKHDGPRTSRPGFARFQQVGLGSLVWFNEVLNALTHDLTDLLFIDDVDAWRTISLQRQIPNDGTPCLFEIAPPAAPSSEGSDGSALVIYQDRLEQACRSRRRLWRL
jgi:hypothetical protein